jgi:hypothetical protein
MPAIKKLVLFGVTLVLASCGEPGAPVDPSGAAGGPAFASGGVKLTGNGHHTRTVGGVTEDTKFTFHANAKPGGTTGSFHYDFRANGFAVSGTVSCVTVNGNQAWVGGVVDKVVTDNPAFESLLGLEAWWRSIDNGEGSGAPPDSTTGLGFGFPGSTITSASWCADQPVALVLREVEQGNVQLH